MRQEVYEFLSSLSAEATANLENRVGEDGLTMMLSSAFARLAVDEMHLEVVTPPPDGAGDAGAPAKCLLALDSSQLGQFTLEQMKNDTSGAEKSVHARRGQKDVMYDETQLVNKYKQTLRNQKRLHVSMHPHEALRKSCLSPEFANSIVFSLVRPGAALQ